MNMQIDWKETLGKMWTGFSSQMLKMNWGVTLKRIVEGFFSGLKRFLVDGVKDIFGT